MAISLPGSQMVSPLLEADVANLTQVGATSGGLPTGSDGVDSLITRAYDLVAQKNFRRRILFSQFPTLKPTRQSHTGAMVSLNIVDDLDDSPTTATLVEQYDVMPTPLKSWKSDIQLAEYGRAVTTTALVRGTSMVTLDMVAAERTGRNMAATMERLAFLTLVGTTTGVTKAGVANSTAPTVVTVSGSASDTLRAAYQSFQNNSVEPMGDGYYIAVMTPANASALRKEADAAGWRNWVVYSENTDSSGMIGQGYPTGYMGDYEGFHIFVTPLTGLSTYGCVMFGQDALAKTFSTAPGFSSEPGIVIAPVTDRLRRFASVGWYWLGGFARFRAEAVVTGDLTG